jgi:hypothetical protein
MASIATSKASQARLPFAVSLAVTLSMAVVYTVLDVIQPAEPLLSLLAFIPGVISIIMLLAAGLTRNELNLRLARLSLPGLGALAAVIILLLPILGSSSSWVGWQWLPALVYGPTSGIAQELYFRASLLPALERAFKGKKTLALFVHSAIFVGFHFRTFQALPSLPMALLVTVVLFLAGCAWGWQVQRDRTVVWSMLQHSLFLALMSMFDWG